jgi:broad specificity phosphatase PhoE
MTDGTVRVRVLLQVDDHAPCNVGEWEGSDFASAMDAVPALLEGLAEEWRAVTEPAASDMTHSRSRHDDPTESADVR